MIVERQTALIVSTHPAAASSATAGTIERTSPSPRMASAHSAMQISVIRPGAARG